MSITVGELKEVLEDFADDVEVRLMTQPSWPFEYSISGMVLSSDIGIEDGDDEQFEPKDEDEVLYLLEGTQLGYGSKAAWDEV